MEEGVYPECVGAGWTIFVELGVRPGKDGRFFGPVKFFNQER